MYGSEKVNDIFQHNSGAWFSATEHCMYGELNESGVRAPLCTYRLNWARRAS